MKFKIQMQVEWYREYQILMHALYTLHLNHHWHGERERYIEIDREREKGSWKFIIIIIIIQKSYLNFRECTCEMHINTSIFTAPNTQCTDKNINISQRLLNYIWMEKLVYIHWKNPDNLNNQIFISLFGLAVDEYLCERVFVFSFCFATEINFARIFQIFIFSINCLILHPYDREKVLITN